MKITTFDADIGSARSQGLSPQTTTSSTNDTADASQIQLVPARVGVLPQNPLFNRRGR